MDKKKINPYDKKGDDHQALLDIELCRTNS